MADTSWVWKQFEQLAPAELYAVLRLRAEVFVVEQNCAYLDMDNRDQRCRHLLGWQNDQLVAYLRLLPPALMYDEPSIGRVINSLSVRGTGVGRSLFAEGVREAERLYPGRTIRIGAQRYLERFYGGFGFAPDGEPYIEDGIPHIQMIRRSTR